MTEDGSRDGGSPEGEPRTPKPVSEQQVESQETLVPSTRASRSNSDLTNITLTPNATANSNGNGGNTSNVHLPTTLRAKLARNSSSNSVSDSAKNKMKMKLQLSNINNSNPILNVNTTPPILNNIQSTPMLLSPRGTPTTSPGYLTSDHFFANYESSPHHISRSHQSTSHLDNLLDDSLSPHKNANNVNNYDNDNIKSKHNPNTNNERFLKIPSGRSSRANSTTSEHRFERSSPQSSSSKVSPVSTLHPHAKATLHQLQTQLQRLPSNSNVNTPGSVSGNGNLNSNNSNSPLPNSPINVKKPKFPPQVSEPVRPQTSILKSNINTKFSQQYQQQEKSYLKGITKYRNRYKIDDDYYDKSVAPEDVQLATSTSTDSMDLGLGKLSIDSELFVDDDADDVLNRNNKEREYEALKALSLQIGSDLLDQELETFSEYTLDSNLLLDLLDKNDEIQLQNTGANSSITERLEWQVMLQTVLTGDVVTGEKTKIVKPIGELDGENLLHVGMKEDFWIGIRAKLYGRTEDEQRRLVLYHRGFADEVFREIMDFKLEFPTDQVDEMSYYEKVKFASKRVGALLEKYEKYQELWRTQKEMETDKPQCATPEFINRINCLVAWTSVTDAIERESDVLKKWVGNDSLDILKPASDSRDSPSVSNVSKDIENPDERIFKDDRSFVERILKEKDIENLFNKRLFSTFSHWTIKAKNSYLEYHEYFDELGLPSYLENLFVLTSFPSNLMKEIIKTRLAYSEKVKNPTIMMIDQILDDLKMYLRVALEIRISLLEYCAPVDGWVSFPDYQDLEFDNTIMKCIDHYVNLLNRKLLFSPKGSKSFRTFKEPEELEKEWLFLQNMGFYINNCSVSLSLQICNLLIKLITRLYSFLQHQIQGPPSDGYRLDSQRLIRWYTSSISNFGQLRRKFLRFHTHLYHYFQNAISFKILPQKTQRFFNLLKEYNHALYHSPKIAENGVYIFVSESLVNRPYDVECILKRTYLGVDFSKIPQHHLDVIQSYHPTIQYYTTQDNYIDNEDHVPHASLSLLDYVIVIVPPKALMWDGVVIPFEIDEFPITPLTRGGGMLITKGGLDRNVDETFEIFKDFVKDTLGSSSQRISSVPQLEEKFQSSLKLFSRITCMQLDCIPTIRNQCRGVGKCQELVNNVFMFSRDIGRDSIRNNSIFFGNSHMARGTIILRLIKLSIEWLSFIVDDCSPTDPKTFRWCVAALEFAMDVTRGFNILTLDSEKFYRLKDKVAGCMSLLISHFDIMGARANELQKSRMQNYDCSFKQDMFTLDYESLGSLRRHIMSRIKEIEDERRELQVDQKSVGRVLDNTDMENQLLTYLASSFSSVSIRWQKGKFLGGGTFGSVYACINLDTGGPMAVKEIRFQDRQSIKTVVPAIKGEMSVLELLSHPNIVQFFGVEVHRDRVYIFMEYCSGGSLAGLLEYGRIEDEIVIQLYTLQMLEGLAYLHQFGIVHRDVKPDNILLDHMGVIKFVDFGSAKVIAIPNSSSSSTLASSNNSNGNSAAPVGEEFTSTNAHNGSDEIKSESSTISSNMSLNEIINRSHASLNTLGGAPNGSMSHLLSKNSLRGNGNAHALTGTPMYMSPETIKGDASGKFGSMDIWSLGCCVLEMATGRRPWSNLDNEFAVMYHIAAGHLPLFPSKTELSPQGQDFLSKCLTIDPMKRSSAVELLQHPWMQSIRNEAFSDQDL